MIMSLSRSQTVQFKISFRSNRNLHQLQSITVAIDSSTYLPCSQVSDYGLCLKTGAKEVGRFYKMKVALLKLFLMSGQGQYARSLMCDLLVMTHQRRHVHPIHKLAIADPHCFNEEAGEISLSVLARLNLGMKDKRSLDVMTQRFQMSKASMLISHYLNPAMRRRVIPKRTKKYTIDPIGQEVQTTTHFFRGVILACIANQHQDVEINGNKSIQNKSGMNQMRNRASVLPQRRWWNQGEVNAKFDAQVDHMKRLWFTQPYCSFAHPWFKDAFISKVNDLKVAGAEWEGEFDVVPDAMTSESNSGGNSSDAGSSSDDRDDGDEGRDGSGSADGEDSEKSGSDDPLNVTDLRSGNLAPDVSDEEKQEESRAKVRRMSPQVMSMGNFLCRRMKRVMVKTKMEGMNSKMIRARLTQTTRSYTLCRRSPRLRRYNVPGRGAVVSISSDVSLRWT